MSFLFSLVAYRNLMCLQAILRQPKKSIILNLKHLKHPKKFTSVSLLCIFLSVALGHGSL